MMISLRARCLPLALLAILVALAGWSAPRSSAAAALSCSNLLTNGNMESSGGWLFGLSGAQGIYSTAQASSPTRSARLGIVGGSNIESYSSMRQTVNVPAGDVLQLSLRIFPLSQPYDDNDRQEVRILDSAGNATLRQVWADVRIDGAWVDLGPFDISEFLGQTIVLYVNVYNNGAGGVTAMYVDDVALEVCTLTDTPTPSPTLSVSPSITPTATPTTAVVTNTPTPTPPFITATPTLAVVTNTPTATLAVVTNTPTPTPPFITATPTLAVVTNTPTPTLAVVTNTPTPTPPFITATPTLAVVTNTPTPTPAVVTNTPTPTPYIVTATPTPGPTATFTPLPPPINGECKECLINTGFENWRGWRFGRGVWLQPGYNASQSYNGERSVLLGNDREISNNYRSYSSVRQRVTLPRKGYRAAYLEFYYLPISDLEGDDRQEVIILDARLRPLAVEWRVNENSATWRYKQLDLTKYMGRTIYVYFNVLNGGGSGRAAMYLDDVSLKICPIPVVEVPVVPPAPLVEVIVVTATPTPTETASPESEAPAATPTEEAAAALPAPATTPTSSLALPAAGSIPTFITGENAAPALPRWLIPLICLQLLLVAAALLALAVLLRARRTTVEEEEVEEEP